MKQSDSTYHSAFFFFFRHPLFFDGYGALKLRFKVALMVVLDEAAAPLDLRIYRLDEVPKGSNQDPWYNQAIFYGIDVGLISCKAPTYKAGLMPPK